jgi:DNA-binding transcriptional ArsR family regulator
MDERQAINAFAALAQESRLRVVRLLVETGPDGLSAGLVADAIGVSASNISFHLKELERAGLVQSRRASRQVIYTADYSAMSGLVQFLMRDCCQGHPEVCTPALDALAACGCAPAQEARHV